MRPRRPFRGPASITVWWQKDYPSRRREGSPGSGLGVKTEGTTSHVPAPQVVPKCVASAPGVTTEDTCRKKATGCIQENVRSVRPWEQYLKKLFAERPSPTLKPLAKASSLSRPRTISFLALAEETEAAFGCCYLSTPRALHLGCAKQKLPSALAGRSLQFVGTLQPPHLSSPNSRACSRRNHLHLNPFPFRWVGSRKEENRLCQKKKSPWLW